MPLRPMPMKPPKTVKPPKVKPPPMVAAAVSPAVRATYPTPSTPAAPAAPTPPRNPPPFDPIRETQRAQNDRVYGDTNVDLDAQDGGIGADGRVIGHGSIQRGFGLDDLSDPFSRAALLRQMYELRRTRPAVCRVFAERAELHGARAASGLRRAAEGPGLSAG
jgi:hypothetical protein